MSNNAPDFIQIPKDVFMERDLSMVDMMTYGLVYWYSKLKNEKCFASNGAFAEILGVTPNKISESLRRLYKKGFIKIVYADKEKRTRVEIIPLVVYGGRVYPIGLGGITRSDKGVYPSGEQSINTIINTKEYSWDESQKKMMEKEGSINDIIATFLVEKKLEPKTALELTAYIKRYAKIAKDIQPFVASDFNKFWKAMDMCKEESYRLNYEWNLETVYKKITKI